MAGLLIEEGAPPGAERVSIMQMVDPGKFWVTEPPSEDMTSGRQDLMALEEIMFRHYRRSAYNKNNDNFLPGEGELVAVQNVHTKRWHRGEIVTILNTAKGYLYQVFLVDYGLQLKVRKLDIRELPHGMTQLKFQAFQVGLYALIPTTVDVDYSEERIKRVECSDWTIAAATFVKNVLKETSSAFLVQKHIHKMVYAEMYLYVHERYINLGDELCEKEFAVRDEDTFLDRVNKKDYVDDVDNSLLKLSSVSMISPSVSLSHSPEYVERENKRISYLKKVDEWRKESMEAMLRDNEKSLSEKQDSVEVVKSGSVANEIQKPDRLSHILSLLEVQKRKKVMEDTKLSDVPVMKTGSPTQLELDRRLLHVNESKVSLTSPQSLNARVLTKKYVDKSPTDKSNCVFIPAGANINSITTLQKNKSGEENKVHSSVFSGRDKVSSKGCKVVEDCQDPFKISSAGNESQIKINTHDNAQSAPLMSTTSKHSSLKLEQIYSSESIVDHPSSKSSNVKGLVDETRERRTQNVSKTSTVDTSVDAAGDNLSGILQSNNKPYAKSNGYSPLRSLSPNGKRDKVSPTKHDIVEGWQKATNPTSLSKTNVGEPETAILNCAPKEEPREAVSDTPKCNNLLDLLRKQQALKKSSVINDVTPSKVTTKIETAPSEQFLPSNTVKSLRITVPKSSSPNPEPSLLDKLRKFQAQNKSGIVTTTKARLPKCAQQSSSVSVTSSSGSSNSPLTDSQQSYGMTKLNRFEPEPIDLPPIDSRGFQPKLYVATTMAERLQMDTVLVHGEYRHCKPLMARTQAGFPKEVHQALDRLGFHDPMRIQKYAWPALLRGHNLVIVSPPRSGKTLAYTAPLIGFLFQQGMYTDLPRGNGPVTLILCSSSNSAQHVYHTCSELMTGHDKLSVVVTYGGGAEMEKMVPLINGCDILISTPRCYLRLLKHSRLITNLRRLSHLVLDEADTLTLKFLPEVKTIINEVLTVLKKRESSNSSIQFITASMKWCPALESFARNIPRPPCICIASHLEAAVYARLKPVLHFVEPHNRIDTVRGILEMQQGLFRTVVACQQACEVDELATALVQSCQNLLIAHENMLHFNINSIHAQWSSMSVPGRYPVLLCSDVVLRELKLQDAMRLVHYTLPSDSKTVFGFRFSCLMNNYRDMLEPICEEDVLTPDCMVHILIDENNSQQLPPIVQFMKRLGATISPTLETTTAEAACKREVRKGDVPLCYSLKAFGDCWDKSVCPDRHIIRKTCDTPTNIPTCGTVKLKILNVHDACSFSARLLEHTNLEGEMVPLPDQYVFISLAIGTHFRNRKNRVAHGIPNLNDICAVETKVNLFQRVQVMAITKTDSSNNADEVQVHYLDEGNKDEVKVFKLFALPPNLQSPPPQVVDIFLCRLAPCDLDWRWSRAASLKVYDWLDEARQGESEGMFMVGKIALSIGNAMWLDPLECHQHLLSVGTTMVVVSLRHKLLDAGLAVENSHHLDRLRTLCKDAGLELPSPTPYIAPLPANRLLKPPIPTKVQWAHLDSEDWQLVTFVTGNNPAQFFVRPIKFEDLLNTLVKKLQKVAEESKDHGEVLQQDSYCLGKFPDDGLWYRAKVQSVEHEKLNLFFVDHGDSAVVDHADAVPITSYWLTKLPFQAIECCLTGVRPLTDNTWSDEATDALFEITAEENNGPVKLLYLKVCKKLKPAAYTGNYLYHVVLVETNNEKDIVLNSILADRGLAVLVESEAHFLEISSTEVKAAQVWDNADANSEDEDVPKAISDSNVEELILPEEDNLKVTSFRSSNQNFDAEKFLEFINTIDSEELLEFMQSTVNQTKPGVLSIQEHHSTVPVHSLPSCPESVCSEEVDLLHLSQSDCKRSSSVMSDSSEQSTGKATENKTEDLPNVQGMPPLASSTRTPEVLWRQDVYCVWIKINLVGVQKYYLSWTINNLQFSTELDGSIYYLDLNLFGCMDPAYLEHSAKGLQIVIKLIKSLEGFEWARLLKQEGRRQWLKYDFEEVGQDTDPYRRFKVPETDDIAQSEAERQELKEGKIVADFMVVDPDRDDDSGSDVHVPDDEVYDPFDPLS